MCTTTLLEAEWSCDCDEITGESLPEVDVLTVLCGNLEHHFVATMAVSVSLSWGPHIFEVHFGFVNYPLGLLTLTSGDGTGQVDWLSGPVRSR